MLYIFYIDLTMLIDRHDTNYSLTSRLQTKGINNVLLITQEGRSCRCYNSTTVNGKYEFIQILRSHDLTMAACKLYYRKLLVT